MELIWNYCGLIAGYVSSTLCLQLQFVVHHIHLCWFNSFLGILRRTNIEVESSTNLFKYRDKVVKLACDKGYTVTRFGQIMFSGNVYEHHIKCAGLLLQGVGKC